MSSCKPNVFNSRFISKLLIVVAFALVVTSSSLLYFTMTSAQGVNDFVITSFVADYDLTNDDPQGFLTSTETLNVDFSGQNHGILRAIPTKFGKQDTNPRVLSVHRDGEQERYVTYEENSNLVVKIGDGNVFVTGKHEYVVVYTVENVITFQDDHDEFYWDINGNEWLQTFENVSVNVDYKGRFYDKDIVCYTGQIDSTESNCTVIRQTNSFSVDTTDDLGPGETLTIVSAFEKGHFTPPTYWEQHWKKIVGLVFVALELLILRKAYKKWHKFGKDYKSKGITVPYFGRPKKVSVMQAAYVANNSLQSKHITAAIIDLAIRGYIKITETKDKKPKHELELVKKPGKDLAVDELLLLKDLFVGMSVGTKVRLEDKKNTMSDTMASLRKSLDKLTSEKGLYEVSPKDIDKLYLSEFLLSFVVLLLGFVSSTYIGIIGNVIGVGIFIVIIVLGALMSKRSQEGVMLKEHMEGLNLYLKTAQKERLAAHDAVGAPLAPRINEPVRDVKFFEKLLPFAVVYGVEKTWAKAFANIYTEPPEWYDGKWNRFNTLALASSIGATSKVAGSAFTAPSSSGGSGFSGGAGGGGGGGGGGGW